MIGFRARHTLMLVVYHPVPCGFRETRNSATGYRGFWSVYNYLRQLRFSMGAGRTYADVRE